MASSCTLAKETKNISCSYGISRVSDYRPNEMLTIVINVAKMPKFPVILTVCMSFSPLCFKNIIIHRVMIGVFEIKKTLWLIDVFFPSSVYEPLNHPWYKRWFSIGYMDDRLAIFKAGLHQFYWKKNTALVQISYYHHLFEGELSSTVHVTQFKVLRNQK